jgi:hypothetical protein
MQYDCTVRSANECDVVFDDIMLAFKRIGSSLCLTAKMRHGGRKLRHIPDQFYNEAKRHAADALKAYRQAQQEAAPQQGELFG